MQIATDVVGLVDEWAARFFEELDYVNEGENGTRFAEQMQVDLPQVVNCSHLWAFFNIVDGFVILRHLFATDIFTPTVLFLVRWLCQRLSRNILHDGS